MEDDYLSDKFLVDAASTSSRHKTYSQLRKETHRQSQLKNEKHRLKSRHQRELESRQEGLSTSLFERVKDEGSKALDIMMKMGFKPGQPLGKHADENPETEGQPPPESSDDGPSADSDTKDKPERVVDRTVPLPINEEWKGKKGIGLGKRAQSPTADERVAKMARMAENSSRAFRDRSQQVYEERRAEGRLRPSQRTCMNLDEKAGKSFNVLWLDPNNPESFPPNLLDALEQYLPTLQMSSSEEHQQLSVEARLKKQMQRDALQPLSSAPDDNSQSLMTTAIDEYDLDTLREVAHFTRLTAQDRLATVLAYLRDRYAYCFWCGSQFNDQNEMADQCPGEDEASHD